MLVQNFSNEDISLVLTVVQNFLNEDTGKLSFLKEDTVPFLTAHRISWRRILGHLELLVLRDGGGDGCLQAAHSATRSSSRQEV